MNDRPLNQDGVCRACLSGLRGYDFAYSYGEYEGRLRGLIHDFKYRGVDVLAGPFGDWMVRALPLELTVDLVVPVPLHWRRRMWRGYNQCDLLARPLARRLRVPVARVIRKTRHTETQASSTPAERRSNLTGAFVLTDPRRVSGQRILLVDDVLTTGATAMACGALLRRAGARSVTVLTLARVDRRPADARLLTPHRPMPTGVEE